MKQMLRILIVLLLLIPLPASEAYAGTINQYELEVLEAAKGRFEYEGKYYKVDDAYIKKLSNYLASDEVDLSEGDKELILAMVKDYIAQGVKDGYLTPIDEASLNTGSDADSAVTPSVTPTPEPTTAPITEAIQPTAPAEVPTETPTVALTAAPTAAPEVTAKGSDTNESNKATTTVAPTNSANTAVDVGKANNLGLAPKYIVFIILGIAVLSMIGFFIIRSFLMGNTSYKHGDYHSDILEAGGFMDIHTHILPGVDDGSVDMEETKRLLKQAINEKTEVIIATPHYACGAKNKSVRQLNETLDQVRTEAVKLNPDFKLYLGNELFYSESILEALQAKEALTLAGSRYILIEFSPRVDYKALYRGLGDLVRAGYAPILAHIERYQCLEKNIERILEIIELGCYIQINCGCLINGQVNRKGKFYVDLINRGLVHFIASDCHDSKLRTPNLETAVRALRSKVDERILERIFIENPRKIIENIYL